MLEVIIEIKLTGERTSKLEDRLAGITQSKGQSKKGIKESEDVSEKHKTLLIVPKFV